MVNFNMWLDVMVDCCQLIDWFVLSVFEDGVFVMENECDFVIVLWINWIMVEQVIFGGFVFGDFWEMLGGVVGMVFGMEYCIDKIDSFNDVIVMCGLQVFEILQFESNVAGEIWQCDIFGEISLLLILDVLLIQDLILDLLVCYIEEKNFGGEMIYGVCMFWQVNDWFVLCGFYNMVFCVLNLCEQFLVDNVFGIMLFGGDLCCVLVLVCVDINNDGVFEYDVV